MIRLVLAASTTSLMALCCLFARSGPGADKISWCNDVRAAAQRAERENRWLCLHLSNPDRPLDAELRQALSTEPVVRKLQAAFVCARIENASPAVAEEWIGETAAVAVVLVAPGFGPVAAWFGTTSDCGSASSCEQVVEAALAQSANLRVLRERMPSDPLAVLELARVHQALGTGALAERLLRFAASAPSSPPSCRAEAWALLARALAARGSADLARTAVATCRGIAPSRASEPDVAVTEAMIAIVELRPGTAITRLDEQAPLVEDAALCRLLRSDALHLLGNVADALVVLHGILADSNVVSFHATARARIAHLLSPDHGHAH